VRTKVKQCDPEVMLGRVLDGLAADLLSATDDEILTCAEELRMDLSKPDSAAYAGVTYFARPQSGDFFDVWKDPKP
jgi:hypothetical protein